MATYDLVMTGGYQCPVCAAEPWSHSFEKLPDRHCFSVFYSCPSKASKYYDTPGILAHYEGMLDANYDKPWWWVFDCTDFGVKHLSSVNVAIGLAQLITKKYAHSLKKVLIVHPTWYIRGILNIVWPFLTKEVRDGICIVDDNYPLEEKPLTAWVQKPIRGPCAPDEPYLIRTTF